MLNVYKNEFGDFIPKFACSHCGQSIKPEDAGMCLFLTYKEACDAISTREENGTFPPQEIYQGFPVHQKCIRDFEKVKGEFTMSENLDRELEIAATGRY